MRAFLPVLFGTALWIRAAAAPAPPPAPAAQSPAPSAAAANAARLTLGGITVLQFRAAAGGFSPAERRSYLQSRVIEILSHPELRPDDVHVVPGPGGHSAIVMVGPRLFVTATEADARANQSTPEQLAQTWADNFRRAFAAAQPRPHPHERQPGLPHASSHSGPWLPSHRSRDARHGIIGLEGERARECPSRSTPPPSHSSSCGLPTGSLTSACLPPPLR